MQDVKTAFTKILIVFFFYFPDLAKAISSTQAESA